MIKHDYAIVSVDMHRGHLDPEVATLPLLPAERCTRVIANTARFFHEARKKGVPVISIITEFREPEETLSNPHWGAQHSKPNSPRKGTGNHNLVGEPTTELIPELGAETDYIVDTKKRYSSFMHTELDFVLGQTGCKNVILTGINTSSCVLNAAFDACNRDYKVYLVEDCCDSMDGPEFHDAAVMLVNRILGTVVSSDEMLDIIG